MSNTVAFWIGKEGIKNIDQVKQYYKKHKSCRIKVQVKDRAFVDEIAKQLETALVCKSKRVGFTIIIQ